MSSPQRRALRYQPTILPFMSFPLIRALGPLVSYRREDRRLLAVMYLAGIVLGYAQTQAVNTLPFVRLSFGLDEGDMARLFAITRLGALIAVIYAAFGDRWGRRGPFLLSYMVFFFATGATALSVNATMYTALQVAARMGAAAMAILATVLLAEQMRPDNRAWAVSFYSTAVGLGSGIGLMALPVARLGDETWRWLFTAALIGLLVYPFLSPKLSESPAFGYLDPERGRMTRLLFGRFAGRFWLLALYNLSLSGFSAVAVTFSLERLINDLGISTLQSTVMLLTGGTLGGVGFFIGGRMADAAGRKPVIVISILLGLAGGLGLYWMTSPPLLFLAIFLSALAGSAALPVGAVQRAELFPTYIRATAVQWLHSVAVAGSFLGLYLAASAIDTWGLPTAVALAGTGAALAALAQVWIPESSGAELGSYADDV